MARPRKTLRIRRRTDNGFFEVVGYDSYTGKRIRVQTGTAEESNARKVLVDIRTSLDEQAGLPLSSEPRLGELLKAFAGATVDGLASPATRLQNLRHLSRHLGDVRPGQIGDGTVKRYLDLRRKDRFSIPYTSVEKVGVGDSTVRRELNDLRQALKWAGRQDVDSWFGRPMVPEFRFPVRADRVRRHDWLTKEQARLIADAAAPHCKIFIELALRTAARRSAILGLQWKDVDLERGYVDFGAAVGNKERPIQQLSKPLCLILRKVRLENESDYVITFRGRQIRSIDKAFERAVVRAGFMDGQYSNGCTRGAYSVHILKHTAITWMILAGMSFGQVAMFAQTSVQTIERFYGHHDQEVARAAQRATDF